MSIFVEKKKTGLRLELEALIEDGDGYISPHRVVEWAQANPESKLHAVFEWDDEKAAHKYRLAQARQVIRVHVEQVAESGHRTRSFVSLEKHRMPEEGYQSLERILNDPIERQLLVMQAQRELRRWQEKYRVLSELASVMMAIENATGEEGGE